MNDLIYWIWLSLHCGAGSELGSYLLRHFTTARAVYEAEEAELRALVGIDDNIMAALLDRDIALPEKILEYCEKTKVGIMTCDDPLYPERLRTIHAKPLLLYYRGQMPVLCDNVLIACVGTRKCSQYGERTAYQLGMELAGAGAAVVSGMALGIDAFCQEGALAANGYTVAVLGCGIDRIYPPENKKLMEKIASAGTLLSEFAPGTEPAARNFPIRNRIISGLSQGTVVVEADEHSGSLITARYARMQGRDLFAFPGRVGDPLASGTNGLIREGAKLVTCAYDILEEYELLYPHRIFTERIACAPSSDRKTGKVQDKHPSAAMPKAFTQGGLSQKNAREEKNGRNANKAADRSGLGTMEKNVLLCMTEPMSSDELRVQLMRKFGMTVEIGELLGILTMLEIAGYIEALPGGCFRTV